MDLQHRLMHFGHDAESTPSSDPLAYRNSPKQTFFNSEAVSLGLTGREMFLIGRLALCDTAKSDDLHTKHPSAVLSAMHPHTSLPFRAI